MGCGVRVLHVADLHELSVEGPQRERARLDAASRWHPVPVLEDPLDGLFVVPISDDIDRRVQSAVWTWVRREIARDPRTCSKGMVSDDRSAVCVYARRDEILERQKAHRR